MNFDELYQQLEGHAKEAEQEFGGGGTGIIANARIETGLKVFARGQTQEDTWFPFPLGDKVAEEQASTKAKKFATEVGAFQMINGEPSNRLNVHLGVNIIARRDGAMSGGMPAQWQGDRHLFTSFPKSWMRKDDPNAFRDVVLPSLVDNGIQKFPWEGWVRILMRPDPYKESLGDAGKTDTDQEGNPRFPLVFYVGEVFENEAAAKSTADSAEAVPVAAADIDVPPPGPDWTWTDFASSVDVIRDAGDDAQQIANDYGLSVEAVLVAFGAHRAKTPPPMIAKKHNVSPADIAAAKTLGEKVASLGL